MEGPPGIVKPRALHTKQRHSKSSDSSSTASAAPKRSQSSAAPKRSSSAPEKEPSRPSSATSATGGAEKREKRRRTSKTKAAFTLPECPVYRPTVEEFTEPLDYIASIRAEAEKFGICRIIPPKQWQPSFQLSEAAFKFSTRKQRIHQLYTRCGPTSHFVDCLREHLRSEGTESFDLPMLGNVELDLYKLSQCVAQHGGLQNVINKHKWAKIADELGVSKNVSNRDERLQAFYYRFLLSYDTLQAEEKVAIESRVIKEREAARAEVKEEDGFGFESGKQHTLQSFRKAADDFKETWFRTRARPHNISANEIEAEYWKILETGERHVCVSYGSDIDTTKHGSGFSVELDDPYSKFGWNLNVLPGLEGSILKHVSGISGISMPWMYVGMLFSTFCWHNEDNYLYSINYHHFGAPKLWYGVPAADAGKLEECFAKHMPDEFGKRPLLLHDLVTMLSPERLQAYGVNVCRTVQEERNFVVTFPQAYHSGFSLGYNCGEAVNFAAADWIPFGLKAVDDYAKQRRPVSLDQEQLLINTAKRETNVNTLTYVLPQLVVLRDREKRQRDQLERAGVKSKLLSDLQFGAEMGNIFQQRGGAKMSGTYGGVFADVLSITPDDALMDAGTGRMGGQPQAGGASVCAICGAICHLSLVQTTLQPGPGIDSAKPTRCLTCTLNDPDLAATAPGLTLVQRYTVSQLNQIIATVEHKLPM